MSWCLGHVHCSVNGSCYDFLQLSTCPTLDTQLHSYIPHQVFYFFHLFHWGIADLQCCVNFCYTLMQIYVCVCVCVYIYIYIFILFHILFHYGLLQDSKYLEKAMAPHSSTLAWKIPWTEEPGELQSMGSLRVRHDWVTSLSLFTFMHWRRKWQPTPVFLPGESQGRGSLVGCRLWVAQSWTRLRRLSSSSSKYSSMCYTVGPCSLSSSIKS